MVLAVAAFFTFAKGSRKNAFRSFDPSMEAAPLDIINYNVIKTDIKIQ